MRFFGYLKTCFFRGARECARRKRHWGAPTLRSTFYSVFFRGARREAPGTPEKTIFNSPVDAQQRSGGGFAPDTPEKTLFK